MSPIKQKYKHKVLSLANLPDLLTVKDVATVLRVSKMTVKRWEQKGKIPSMRINARGDRRYKKDSVLWFLGIQSR